MSSMSEYEDCGIDVEIWWGEDMVITVGDSEIRITANQALALSKELVQSANRILGESQ